MGKMLAVLHGDIPDGANNFEFACDFFCQIFLLITVIIADYCSVGKTNQLYFRCLYILLGGELLQFLQKVSTPGQQANIDSLEIKFFQVSSSVVLIIFFPPSAFPILLGSSFSPFGGHGLQKTNPIEQVNFFSALGR